MSKENYFVKRSMKQIIIDAVTRMWSDIKSAKWAIILLIAYFVLSSIFLYSTCPVVMTIGFPCPACGLTRAGMHILGFEFAAAFHMHPFIYVVILWLVIFFVRRYIKLVEQDHKMVWAAVVLILVMTAYYIWRMITYFPSEEPMIYYVDNFLQRIVRIIAIVGRT